MGIDVVQLHDQLLAAQPEGVVHQADSCPFCQERLESQVASASVPTPASYPSGSEPLDAPTISNDSPEGGITTAMSDANANMISRETHEALLEKAVKDATADTQQSLAERVEEVASLKAQIEALTKTGTDHAEEIKRLGSELDAAQVALKVATDEVAALKADAAAKQEAADKAALATKRADQVRELNLFGEQYIAEKASRWADFDEADWEERIKEWRSIKPADSPADTASAMTGTSGLLGDEPVDEAKKTISPRRAVLGLTR